MIVVPIDRLQTTLAPLRGERTDRESALSPMPLRVAALDHGRYEVLDGFKRLALWRGDGRAEVPVVVEAAAGITLKARLLEANSPRKTASPMDEARVVASLIDEDKAGAAAVAKLLSHKPEWVERRLTLARRLAPELATRLDRGRLSLTTALELCSRRANRIRSVLGPDFQGLEASFLHAGKLLTAQQCLEV